MAELNGYVKLHRKMTEWGWYSDHVTKDVFLHLLLTATYKPITYRGYELQPGQTVVGRKGLAVILGFSEQQIRTALGKLERTGEITRQRTNKFTIVTVENWAFYQGLDDDSNQQSTNNQPTINQQSTNNQPQMKNIRKQEDKKNNKNIVQSDADKLFDELWKLYPSKKGKGQVSAKKKRELFDIGQDEMTRAIQRYKKDLEKDADWRKPQNGSTFFNSGYVDYLDKNYTIPNDNKGASNNGRTNNDARGNEQTSRFANIKVTRA